MVYINKVLYKRRIHDMSLTSENNLNIINRRIPYINWVIDFLKDYKWCVLNEFCFNNYCLCVEQIARKENIWDFVT